MRPLILIGGGGHCKSVIDVAESAGFTILGVLDKQDKVGHDILGYQVIGTDDNIPDYADKAEFVITVGQIKNTHIRRRIADNVKIAGGTLATIIANDAYVSRHAQVGEGTVVLHHAFVNAGARIGINCIINTMANIEHDVRVGDFCHISTGTMVNGEVQIGNDVFIGSQSVIANGVTVGNNTIIGAGSCVMKSVCGNGMYYGNPATLKIKP